MPRTSVRALLADTNFWIAAFNPRDEHHARAAGYLERIEFKVIIMPWPIMYEVLRTRTVHDLAMVRSFDRILRRPKIYKLDDTPYRVVCLGNVISQSARRPISLVDMVVRAVLADTRFRFSQFLTFNAGDFADVCRYRDIPMWP